MLFLDPSVDVFLSVVFPLMSIAFILMGVLMVKRLKNYNRRYSMLTHSIVQTTIALASSQIFTGLRFFIEAVFREELDQAAINLINGGSKTSFFVFYWFLSITFTEYAGYVSLIMTIWIRKKKDWDRLLRLPLKLPKTTSPDMQNLLGGLWNEIETNRFKDNLIEGSEITYRKTKLDGF